MTWSEQAWCGTTFYPQMCTKPQIKLYNKDVCSLIENYLYKFEPNAFVYFDPPYFEKGKQLYLNFFTYSDHVRIEKMISEKVGCDWVITYDDVETIADIYPKHQLWRFDLNYSVAKKRIASEIVIFKNRQMIPTKTELRHNNICINLRVIKKDGVEIRYDKKIGD